MTDDDRNLLERAARAAGYKPVRLTDDGTALLLEGVQQPWSPLHENQHSDCMGDALRLAVRLQMSIEYRSADNGMVVRINGRWIEEPLGKDSAAATRRAIVLTAADIAAWATP